MKTRVIIPMRLPSINEYIYACKVQRGRWNKGTQMKRDVQRDIEPYLKDLGKFVRPVKVDFTWIEPDMKRDLDNVCFAKKFILDAMVNCGVIANDNRSHVTDFSDHFGYEKGKPKIIVEVTDDE